MAGHQLPVALFSAPSGRAGCGIFVTGTDTGVGKTRVAAALLRAWTLRGLRAVGMKPVAAGCGPAAAAPGHEEDVAALAAASNVEAPLDLLNPYRFLPAVAPHLAAEAAGEAISLRRIRDAYDELVRLADRVVVEGAGGFLVPLNDREDFADLARLLDVPVLLVVGMRLGCLNHALLTARAVSARGLRLAGWVANRLDPAMPMFDGNVRALSNRLGMPPAGIIPFGPAALEASANLLDIERLEADLC